MDKGICSLPTCSAPRYLRGWCRKHYRAWSKYGDPEVVLVVRHSGTPEQRFWPKVNKQGPVPPHRPDLGPCWVWTAAGRNGYGNFRSPGESQAHRFSWTLHYGPIPDGLHVLHRCDNPPCVRPDHLFVGTRADNAQDMIAKNRHAWAGITHCPKGHEYTPENTLLEAGKRRACRECKRESYRQWRARNLEAVRAADTAKRRVQRAANPAPRREADRRYYARNRERLAAEARAYRARKRAEKET